MSYTRGMERDLDTPLPEDPRIRIGTISADKIVAGEFDWDKFDLLMRPLINGGPS